MKLWQRHRARFVTAVLVVGVLAFWFTARKAGEPSHSVNTAATAGKPAAAPSKPPFDFYLLALTLHPAFCADGHTKIPECRARAPRPLVIHGLWPENLKPRTYPHDCPTNALELDAALEQELADWMPGMASNLHQHEWKEHGGCSGLEDDDYFRRSIDLAAVLDRALSAKLTTLAGQETTPDALREVADLYHPGIAETFTLHCRTLRDAPPGQRGQAFLVEVRQCVDNDGPDGAPGKLLDCASVQRRDQGCGARFRIAASGAGT